MAFWIDDIKNDLGVTVIKISTTCRWSRPSPTALALNNGRMLALGTPSEVQSDPADRGLSGGEAP